MMRPILLACAFAVAGGAPALAEPAKPPVCPGAVGTASPQASTGLRITMAADDQRGGRLGYRATVMNPGTALAGVTVVDDLRCLLDDAALVGTPTVSTGLSSVTGTLLEWRLDLPAKASATLAFRVELKGSGDGRLDHLLSVRGAPSSCAKACRVVAPPVRATTAPKPVSPGATVAPRTKEPAPAPRAQPNPEPKPAPLPSVPVRIVPPLAPPPVPLAGPVVPGPVIAPTTPADLVLADVPPILPEAATPMTATPVAGTTKLPKKDDLRFGVYLGVLGALPLLALLLARRRARRRRPVVPAPRTETEPATLPEEARL